MSNINIFIGGLTICLGCVIYKSYCNQNYTHDIDIPLYEINNILSKEQLNYQFDRDYLRYNLDLDIEKILINKPQLKIFFTQTVYNYLYHYYLVPNLLKKKYFLFDKTNLYKSSMEFKNNLFLEERYFHLINTNNEKLIASIKTTLIYKYPSNIVTLNISYISNKNLFEFPTISKVHIV